MPAEIDLASLRVAVTPDFGFSPTERHIRAVLAEKVGLFAHLFAGVDDATPDCTGTDEVFEVLRSVAFMAGMYERVRDTPELVGPNVRANVEEGLTYSALDVTKALKQQTVLYKNWQRFFEDYDVILSPAVTLSPRPWSELYPAEIDGTPTRTYFHWLANAYAVTTVGYPAISLPLGLDHAGMPFGLQIVGPRGGDAKVLAVAAALERELAGDPRTARPVPDIAKLTASAPISAMPGFMGFD
jgi:Asp-tRNA(Asn)/Glu-tRNA(Gln) amidotransferase A subunit family amidase